MELSPRIYATAGALAYSIAKRDMAPDCEQEALLRALRAIRRVDKELSQGHWFIERHMRGAVLDYLRRERRALPAFVGPLHLAYRVADTAPSPEVLAIIRERMRQRAARPKRPSTLAPPRISREEWLREQRG
jgi:DNA-directed RNA polymerase specialized sigma24 family protein